MQIDDVGAGALVDFTQFGFQGEPTLAESIRTGADLVTSSTDKLIGASQGGLILGREALVKRVRKNPLARIVRVDKLTLAVLEATLKLFLEPQRALSEVPTLALLRRGLAEIDAQAARIASGLASRSLPAGFELVDGFSEMGSGSLPGQQLPTRLVAVLPLQLEAGELARRLRLRRPAVFARVHQGRLLIDPRTLLPGEEQPLVEAVAAAPRRSARHPGLSRFFRPRVPLMQQINLTLGTAGHIDHGKTALVKALTGCDTDRLKAEKERGMSIELGYAPCQIADKQVGDRRCAGA